MNALLVTGASGFVGKVLIPKLLARGHRVYGLSRHPPIGSRNLIPIRGDVTEPNLGLEDVPKDIAAVHHLAGIHSLRTEDKDGSIWKTNVIGTKNVIDFCVKHDIPRLYFTSTAYTWEVNPYGHSKIRNESSLEIAMELHNLRVTIFKPSIIMGTRENPYPGHFSQFVAAVIKIHRRAELIRRKLEGTLRLPVIEPVFRVRGNPQGTLNLVPVDAVAEAMANIESVGTFWLTNPAPPTLGQLAEWVGDFIMVKMKFLPEFKPSPIEATFQKMVSAFQPYLQGDNFLPSNLKECSSVDREFIEDTIKGIL